MAREDIRFVQRLASYNKALDSLKSEVELAAKREFSELEKKGVIKSFEYVHELAWKLLKDFLEFTGESSIVGSRDAFELAFQRGLITKGKELMDGIKDRNLTAHTYNHQTADKIFDNILKRYYEAFEEVRESISKEKEKRCLD